MENCWHYIKINKWLLIEDNSNDPRIVSLINVLLSSNNISGMLFVRRVEWKVDSVESKYKSCCKICIGCLSNCKQFKFIILDEEDIFLIFLFVLTCLKSILRSS